MECEQTMTDNVEIVRESIKEHVWADVDGTDPAVVLAALDALVAERDELLGLWHCTPEDKAAMDANLLRVEAERDTANADWHRMRDLHADALTEVARLREAAQPIVDYPFGMVVNVNEFARLRNPLRAALANEDA